LRPALHLACRVHPGSARAALRTRPGRGVSGGVPRSRVPVAMIRVGRVAWKGAPWGFLPGIGCEHGMLCMGREAEDGDAPGHTREPAILEDLDAGLERPGLNAVGGTVYPHGQISWRRCQPGHLTVAD